jgi:hypothetical protein
MRKGVMITTRGFPRREFLLLPHLRLLLLLPHFRTWFPDICTISGFFKFLE